MQQHTGLRPRRAKPSWLKKLLRSIKRTIKREPVQVQGLLQTVLALTVVMGSRLTQDQVGAILAVSASFFALVAKTQVTPVANPRDRLGRPLRARASERRPRQQPVPARIAS